MFNLMNYIKKGGVVASKTLKLLSAGIFGGLFGFLLNKYWLPAYTAYITEKLLYWHYALFLARPYDGTIGGFFSSWSSYVFNWLGRNHLTYWAYDNAQFILAFMGGLIGYKVPDLVLPSATSGEKGTAVVCDCGDAVEGKLQPTLNALEEVAKKIEAQHKGKEPTSEPALHRTPKRVARPQSAASQPSLPLLENFGELLSEEAESSSSQITSSFPPALQFSKDGSAHFSMNGTNCQVMPDEDGGLSVVCKTPPVRRRRSSFLQENMLSSAAENNNKKKGCVLQ